MKLKVVTLFTFIILIPLMVYACRYYYLNAVLWQEKAGKAFELSREQERQLGALRYLQQDIAELDKFYTEKLNEANQNNTTLRARLAAGSHRLCIPGKVREHEKNRSPASSGMGHDATVELSADAGQNIITVREGIISDQQKLMYLQDYVRHMSSTMKEE